MRIATKRHGVTGTVTVLAMAAGLIFSGCGASHQVNTGGQAASNTSQLPAGGSGRPIAAPPPPADKPVREVGITDDAQAPFSQSEFGVKNQYSGPYQGKWINIYAGGKRAAPPDIAYVGGGIRIFVGPVDTASRSDQVTSVGEFEAPNAATWVKLLDVRGSKVILQRENGSKVTFDLGSHTFSSE